ncbi:MAG: acyl carrier protein [Anaerolineae bacterium]|nr:acyl carrier protein [Anaerolineae bacterium]
MSVKEQIRQFIVNEFLFGQNGTLEDSASLLDAGILDSMGVLQTLFYLEETFGIQVEDDEVMPDNIDSIDNLANFVARKQNVPA